MGVVFERQLRPFSGLRIELCAQKSHRERESAFNRSRRLHPPVAVSLLRQTALRAAERRSSRGEKPEKDRKKGAWSSRSRRDTSLARRSAPVAMQCNVSEWVSERRRRCRWYRASITYKSSFKRARFPPPSQCALRLSSLVKSVIEGNKSDRVDK